MKRDTDYMIELLRRIEADENALYQFPPVLDMDDKEYHHLQLLCDQGMVEQVNNSAYRITHWGHNMLENIDKGRLKQIKRMLMEKFETEALEVISSIGWRLLKSEIGLT